MNFLSHYYLHNDKNDNYFTVGLTMPDLLGFHSRRIRISKRFLKEKVLVEKDDKIRSHIAGMTAHLDLDNWFHHSDFFKEKVTFLQNDYIKFNDKKDKLPHFYAHILLEILIDRYLLIIQPDIADNFYESYKEFDFYYISKLFVGLKHFDRYKFISFASDVANSNFLREYIYDHLIISILSRVSKRIEIPMTLNYDDNLFTKFIRESYSALEPSIKIFINKAKSISMNKDEIIKKIKMKN